MIRIVLADDHEVVRAGIKALLDDQSTEMEVVAEAADGVRAYEMVAYNKPDILLMDISMPPGESGLIACEKIATDFPDTKIIILTMFAEPEYLYYTLKGGASGYTLKTSTTEELLTAIRTVHDGDTYVHPKMTSALTKQLFADESESTDSPFTLLTNRELEVFQLLAKGYTNKEISEQLYLSVKTIEAHRAKINTKLGFKTRADLVSFAIKHKLLEV